MNMLSVFNSIIGMLNYEKNTIQEQKAKQLEKKIDKILELVKVNNENYKGNS